MGKEPEPSFFADASANGDDVFFFTVSQLVGQDRDELLDVYDASVEGGLAYQNAVEGKPCEPETCKGTPSEAPPTQVPGSASFSGSGNVKERQKPKPRCAKGKHAVRHNGKTRCVKKKAHKRQQGRNAKTTRRTSR
jgi:hypothetical protein